MPNITFKCACCGTRSEKNIKVQESWASGFDSWAARAVCKKCGAGGKEAWRVDSAIDNLTKGDLDFAQFERNKGSCICEMPMAKNWRESLRAFSGKLEPFCPRCGKQLQKKG